MPGSARESPRRRPRGSRSLSVRSRSSRGPTRFSWRLRVLRAGARPATAVVIVFVDAHRARFGVAPICRVLSQHGVPIAPSTYYAARSRLRSARSIGDEAILAEVTRVHSDPAIGRGLYGARKVWHQLRREGTTVGRCRVERLMRIAGLQGVRRGKAFVTTKSDPPTGPGGS